MNNELAKEQEHLKYTIEKYNTIIDEMEHTLSNFDTIFRFEYDEMMERKFIYQRRYSLIRANKEKPYFARIDFKDDINLERCYIGKLGVIDDESNILTIDWRSPIANLYYDSNIGKTSYEAPQGIIEGELLLKRQYEIDQEKLINYFDVDTVSNDELLKPYLNVNADSRLKNIVATIQAEQNKIIRKDLNKNIFVQGVAGSGKTTVALHRIAYLEYQNKHIFKGHQYMVLGPNKFFINYISNVLPDLDVSDSMQLDFPELCNRFLGENIIISNEVDEYTSYKSSFDFKYKINNFMNMYEYTLMPKKDLMYNNFKIMSLKEIMDIYNALNATLYTNVVSKIDRTIILVAKIIKDSQNELLEKFYKTTDSSFERRLFKAELDTYFKVSLRKLFNIRNLKVSKIYDTFLKENNMHSKNIKFEDLAPLIYIKYYLYGAAQFDDYRHIVIDEAQDYGYFSFDVLKTIFKNSSFSIFGDLAQSLYPNRSIDSWEQVINNTFNGGELLYLNKSYRTTIEIMEEANKINKLLKLTEATSVIRHGNNVKYVKLANNKIDLILDIIANKKDYKTIAIISKTDKERDQIYNELIKNNINLTNVSENHQEYKGGMCTITSRLAKGLEFDMVIITDASQFDKNNILDMKLLYVTMTRPLHELHVLYENNIDFLI